MATIVVVIKRDKLYSPPPSPPCADSPDIP